MMFLRAAVGNAMLATLLALIAAGASCFLGRRPALRHALGLWVLLKRVPPPLSRVPRAWVALPAADDPRMPAEPLNAEPLREIDVPASVDITIVMEEKDERVEPSPA